MGLCKIPLDGKHNHHIVTLKRSLGLLDMFRSIVVPPQVIVGSPFSEVSLYIGSICYALLCSADKILKGGLHQSPSSTRTAPTSDNPYARRSQSFRTDKCPKPSPQRFIEYYIVMLHREKSTKIFIRQELRESTTLRHHNLHPIIHPSQ